MPGSTPCRNYPFPVDADLIDVAGDINKLATAVDTDTCAMRIMPVQRVFANKAALDAASLAGVSEGAEAQAPAGVYWSRQGGAWVLRDGMPVVAMPSVPLTMGNIAPGLTPFPGYATFPTAPYNRIWRGNVLVGLSGHSADGDFRVRVVRYGDNVDLGISATDSYVANKPFVFVCFFSLLVSAGGSLTVYVAAEVGGAGANTNGNGHVLWTGYATEAAAS